MKSNAGLFTLLCIQHACMAVTCCTTDQSARVQVWPIVFGFEPVVTIFDLHKALLGTFFLNLKRTIEIAKSFEQPDFRICKIRILPSSVVRQSHSSFSNEPIDGEGCSMATNSLYEFTRTNHVDLSFRAYTPLISQF